LPKSMTAHWKTELCDKVLSLVPRFAPGFDLKVRFLTRTRGVSLERR
jgi:hypothetical protein